MPPSESPSPWQYVGVGLELAGTIALLAFLGFWFDRWRGTEPWGMLIGASVGIVGGLYNLIKQTIRANRD